MKEAHGREEAGGALSLMHLGGDLCWTHLLGLDLASFSLVEMASFAGETLELLSWWCCMLSKKCVLFQQGE